MSTRDSIVVQRSTRDPHAKNLAMLGPSARQLYKPRFARNNFQNQEKLQKI